MKIPCEMQRLQEGQAKLIQFHYQSDQSQANKLEFLLHLKKANNYLSLVFFFRLVNLMQVILKKENFWNQ